MAATINVNVADQGFPPPPPASQALPLNIGRLINGSEPVGGYIPISLPAGMEPAVNVGVEGQGGIAPLSSVGVSLLPVIDVDVDSQQIGSQFPDQFIVTPTSGNFRTSVGLVPDIVTATILAVTDAETGGAVTSTTSKYKLTLSADLTQFGISFIGRKLEVVSGYIGNIGQTRFVQFWSVNTVYINVTEDDETFTFFNRLMPGDSISLPTQRDGDEVVYDLRGLHVEVTPQVLPGAVPVTQAPTNFFRGNVQPSSGVRGPFAIGIQGLPPFIGTFEVEDQPVLGGLPVNVFV